MGERAWHRSGAFVAGVVLVDLVLAFLPAPLTPELHGARLLQQGGDFSMGILMQILHRIVGGIFGGFLGGLPVSEDLALRLPAIGAHGILVLGILRRGRSIGILSHAALVVGAGVLGTAMVPAALLVWAGMKDAKTRPLRALGLLTLAVGFSAEVVWLLVPLWWWNRAQLTRVFLSVAVVSVLAWVGWGPLLMPSITTRGTFNFWFLLIGPDVAELSIGVSPALLGGGLMVLGGVLGLSLKRRRRGLAESAFEIMALRILLMSGAHPGLWILLLVIPWPDEDPGGGAEEWVGAMATLNLIHVTGLWAGFCTAVHVGLGALIAGINLIVFPFFHVDSDDSGTKGETHGGTDPDPADTLPIGREVAGVFVLVVGMAALRFVDLGFPENRIFDEVYHARAAVEILEGTGPNEWVHPPLAKLLIACGVKVFGDNGFGWRFLPWLVGSLVLPLLYFLARSTLGDPRLAFLGTALFALDGCYFVMSRTAMTNVFALFFQVATVTFFWRYLVEASKPGGTLGYGPWLLATSVSIGLGVSTRWTCLWLLGLVGGVYALHGVVSVYRLWRGSTPVSVCLMRFGLGVLSGVAHFLVLPLAIYVLSYMPLIWTGSYENLNYVASIQPQIYKFHTTFTTHHPYYSQWYTWAFLYRPVWYFYESSSGMVQGILSLGNPLLWWASIPAVVLGMRIGWRERDAGLLYLVAAYGALYLPWALSPRTLNYSHYYLEPLPYALVVLAGLIGRGYRRHRLLPELLALVGSVALAFAFFYPILTGLTISQDAYGMRVWLGTWL